jgi:hypothetical protein
MGEEKRQIKHLEVSNSAQEKVAAWNRKYLVGTKIICHGYTEKLVTRTKAMVLFGHRAAIYIENYNGYFDLEEITPLQACLCSMIIMDTGMESMMENFAFGELAKNHYKKEPIT